MSHHDPPPTVPALRSLAEVIAALAVVGLVWYMFVNWGQAYLCWLGDCPSYDEGQVATYRALAICLAFAVVASLTLAIRRRARWGYLWHVPAALLAVAATALLAVPSVDWEALLTPDPEAPHSPAAPPCHSGSGDCPGG